MNSTTNRLDELASLVPPGTEAAILAVDKPVGMTSHDVVARIRKQIHMKVGHAGTLDPFATGLLLILIGRATRLQRYLLGLPKRYLATARLGWTSTTGDPDGELVETGRVPSVIRLPTGEIEQMVPLTSAVKVEGERLYKKAHRGETEADRPVRRVTVYSAELLDLQEDEAGVPVRARFEVEVSSGTYVRTLVENLDDAYCEELRRTAIGPIELGGSEGLVPIEEAVSFMPSLELDLAQRADVSFGRPPGSLELPEGPGGEDQAICLTFQGSVVAIARNIEGSIRPEVVLEPA